MICRRNFNLQSSVLSSNLTVNLALSSMISYPSRVGVLGRSSQSSLEVPSSWTLLCFPLLGRPCPSVWGRLGQGNVAPKHPVDLSQVVFSVGELSHGLPKGEVLLGQELQVTGWVCCCMGTGTGTKGVAILCYLASFTVLRLLKIDH